MSRKSRQERRKNKEQRRLERRKQTIAAASEKRRMTWLELVAAWGALVAAIAAVVALVVLRPHLDMSPTTLLTRSQPLTMQFEMVNNGSWLAAHDTRVACLIREYDNAEGGGIRWIVVSNTGWNGGLLESGDKQTVVCSVFHMAGTPKRADLLFLVSYGVPPFRFRRYFHFEGLYADEWVWQRQPAPDDADEIMDSYEHGRLSVLEGTQRTFP